MNSRSEWVAELKAFTSRNAGRRTTLEVDGPELGAQHEERGYPLRGVAYDPRDGRVEIMVGDLASVDRHLTHTLAGVTDIEVQKSHDGRDLALLVAQGEVQTVLKLT
jgi:hypothetical protein